MTRTMLLAARLPGLLGGRILGGGPCDPGGLPAEEFLGFERDAFIDLDSGEHEVDAGWDSGWDITVQQDRVIRQNQQRRVEIAHLEGREFDSVTWCEVGSTGFTREIINRPFNPGLIILVRSDRGRFFKVGNPRADAAGIGFDLVDLMSTRTVYEAYVSGAVRVAIQPAEAPQPKLF